MGKDGRAEVGISHDSREYGPRPAPALEVNAHFVPRRPRQHYRLTRLIFHSIIGGDVHCLSPPETS